MVSSAYLPSADGATTPFCTNCRAIDMQFSSTPGSRAHSMVLTAEIAPLGTPALRGGVAAKGGVEGAPGQLAHQ